MTRLPRPVLLLAALLATAFSAAAAAADYYDPPGRVARISDTRGDVSYSPAGEDGWYDVRRNRPLVRGDRLWSDDRARAEFQVGSAAVRMDQNTSVEILELNDRLVQLDVSEGTVNLRVRRLYAGQEFEIDTPNIAFVVNRPGNYRIDVDPDNDNTTTIVWQGSATAYGDQDRFPLRNGDAVRFYGRDLRDYDDYALPRADAFDRYCFYRDSRLDRSVSLRYLGDDVIGYSDLDDYGDWRATGGYGNVWYPRNVDRDWAPYRDGQWYWIDPWGWTWVDDAPWGFAPAHYGRWVYVSGRWGWIPCQRNYRPVYAPALVVFVGGRGWNLSVSLGGDSSIGWFPLGPRDVYVPPYQASQNYFTQVNVSNTVVNNVTINNYYTNYANGSINVNQANYANRRVANAVTAVPAKVFVNSQPVRPALQRMDADTVNRGQLARLAPIAPRARNLAGNDANSNARPSREILDRPVFVRTPPPANPRPFAERQQRLQQQPGQPVATPPPAPAAQDIQRRNFRMIRGNAAAAADARAEGSRRDEVNPAESAGPPKPLDRAAPTRRPLRPDRQDRQDTRDNANPNPPPPAANDAQAPARAQAQADQQAREQARQQAQADQQAREQARQQAQADQQAREQARAQAQADQQAREQARQNQAQQGQAEPPPETARLDGGPQPTPAEREARRAAERANRKPPGCVTPAEVEQMKRRAERTNTEMPQYVLCDGGGN